MKINAELSIFFLIGFICLLQGTSSKVLQNNLKNVVWFPDPNEQGKLIPAYLEPSERRIEFNESFIHFYLYTKQNPDTGDEIIFEDADSLAQSHFIRGAPVKIMSHGYGGSATADFPRMAKNEYMKLDENLNVIAIDWEALAENPYYFEAVGNTKTVGRRTAHFLEWLISEQAVAREQIHILGFSLGAQVAGITGSNMNQLPTRVTDRTTAVQKGSIGKLSTLDPAKPLFEDADPADRVDPTDGEFVEVIHTAGLTVAFLEPQGHCDFYPNGGATQPGCGEDEGGWCAHARAPSYLEESIANPFGFKSVLCPNFEDYENNLCTNNHIQFMGPLTAAASRGNYYLTTNSESPFARG